MKVILVGPGESSFLAKLLAKEFEGHGISIAELRALKLKIEDYSKDANLRPLIREYYNAMDEYVRMKNINLFVQNRVFL